MIGEIYFIGCVVAVVICAVAFFDNYKSRNITRGMLAILVAVVVSSWFAVVMAAAVAIDESEWGSQVVFKKNSDEDKKA